MNDGPETRVGIGYVNVNYIKCLRPFRPRLSTSLSRECRAYILWSIPFWGVGQKTPSSMFSRETMGLVKHTLDALVCPTAPSREPQRMCAPQLAFTSWGAERRKEKGGGENRRKRGTAIFSDLVSMTAPHWPPPSAPIGALQARPPVRPRRVRHQISPRLAPSIPVSWLCRRRGPRTQR